MAGFGGVSANGRNWRTPFPRMLYGEAAAEALDTTPAYVDASCGADDHFAAIVSEWVATNVHVTLTADAVDAVVYVVDRLVDGVGRPALLRGGHSSLASDPAMRHLGFSPTAARTFARWLLGRPETGRAVAAVLDAVVTGARPLTVTAAAWRTCALDAGFAVPGRRGLTEPPGTAKPTDRQIA